MCLVKSLFFRGIRGSTKFRQRLCRIQFRQSLPLYRRFGLGSCRTRMLLSDQSSHPLTKHELRQRERDHDSKENAQAEREHNDKVPRARFASHIRTLNRKAER